MLRSLEIQNFKGIKEGKLEDLAQVNVLVGRNNSGKSTILDALIMLRCPFMGRDFLDAFGPDQILKRRIDRGAANYNELWFGMDSGVPLILRAKFPNQRTFTEEWSGGLFAKVRSENYEYSADLGHSPQNYMSTEWRRLTQHIGEKEANRVTLIHLLDATSIHYPFAERLWPELVKDRREDRVRQMLERIYDIEIQYIASMPFPVTQRLVAALPHAGVAVDWLGDGMRYAVNILALGVLLKGTALLVEELETHQHPESLRKLTQTLFELAKQQELQLFLTTHSMELITYALDAAEEKGIDLKLYHLNLDKEGTLRATPFSQPNAQLMLDIGHDPRLHYKYIGVE